jgi:hypothetical protein
VPGITLDPADTAELAELLQFLADWLGARNGHLDASLRAFTGNDAYDAQHLRAGLDRFTFLLGGNDGEQLFGRLQRQRATRRPRRPDEPKPPPTVIALSHHCREGSWLSHETYRLWRRARLECHLALGQPG